MGVIVKYPGSAGSGSSGVGIAAINQIDATTLQIELSNEQVQTFELPQGPQGRGIDRVDQIDAFTLQLWFTTGEYNWITLTQGPQGPQGDPGQQGSQGDQGPQGPQGEPGIGIFVSGSPYEMLMFDTEGNLITTRKIYDSDGNEVFDFRQKGAAITESVFEDTALLSFLGATDQAALRDALVDIRGILLNQKSRINDLESRLKDTFQMIR